MKKISRLALCAGLVAALSVPALAASQGDFSVVVNGQAVTFPDAVPQIRDNRSCLPFAAVFQQLGYQQEDITWDGDTRTVTAVKGDTSISLTIGQASITLNGSQKIDTDVAPYIDQATNRTYVPLGLVADALGYQVNWDGQTRTVAISDAETGSSSSTGAATSAAEDTGALDPLPPATFFQQSVWYGDLTPASAMSNARLVVEYERISTALDADKQLRIEPAEIRQADLMAEIHHRTTAVKMYLDLLSVSDSTSAGLFKSDYDAVMAQGGFEPFLSRYFDWDSAWDTIVSE